MINSQSKLGSVIVFMPLKKHVDPAMNTGKKVSSLAKHESRKVIDYQSYLQKQGYNVVSGKNEPAAKKVAKKTVLKKPTVIRAGVSVASSLSEFSQNPKAVAFGSKSAAAAMSGAAYNGARLLR